eukprot:73505-Rhodomonas_salina.1
MLRREGTAWWRGMRPATAAVHRPPLATAHPLLRAAVVSGVVLVEGDVADDGGRAALSAGSQKPRLRPKHRLVVPCPT